MNISDAGWELLLFVVEVELCSVNASNVELIVDGSVVELVAS